jgi:hypothetical protein
MMPMARFPTPVTTASRPRERPGTVRVALERMVRHRGKPGNKGVVHRLRRGRVVQPLSREKPLLPPDRKGFAEFSQSHWTSIGPKSPWLYAIAGLSGGLTAELR